MNLNKLNDKREFRAYYDIKFKFTKKAFGQKFVDLQGATYFNLMSFDLKKMFIVEPGILKILLLSGLCF